MSDEFTWYKRKRSWTIAAEIVVFKDLIARFAEKNIEAGVEFYTKYLEIAEAAYAVAIAREQKNKALKK